MTKEELEKLKKNADKYSSTTSRSTTQGGGINQEQFNSLKENADKYASSTARYATQGELANYYKNGAPTLTDGIMKARYGHVLKSQAYMSLSDNDRALMQLNNQVNAYKKAKDVFDKISYSERNSTAKKSDSWQKSKTLVDNLEKELQTQYKSIFGADADFKKWLGGAVMQGVNQFNVGLANTGAMASNLIPGAINDAIRYLQYGHDIGSTAQLRSEEELKARQNSLIEGAFSGGWVNQYEQAIGRPDEEMRGWLSSYEKLKRRANELSAKGNYNEADIYNNRAQEFYDRISNKYADYLKSNGNYWTLPEGDDPLSEYAQMVNDVYARGQEEYEKQLEYQKMTASGSGKGYEIAGQFITSATAALPYAGLALMTGGASLAQFVPEGQTLVNAATLSGSGIGAQLAPQTTDIIGKVSNILTSFGKDPQYWLSFAQEAGNTYKEAVDAGADSNVATLTATLVGLINGAIELGFGGNAGIQDLPENLLKGKGAGTRRAIQEWIESALSEGKEEVLQGVISNLAEKIAYNKDMKWIGEGGVIDPQALAQEGYMGGAVGALLGGGQIMGVNIMNESMQNRIDQANARLGQRYSEQADTIIQNARQMGPETRSYQLASNILEKGSNTDAEIGELYRAYMSDTGYNQNLRTNTIQAVQQRLTELGETSDTRELAEIIAKEADGQKITKAETQAIENSKYGQRVVNELFNAYRGDYSSNWVRGLATQDEMAAAKAAPELTQEQRAERIESIEQSRPEHTEEDYKDIDKLAQKYGEQANVFKEAAKSVEGADLYYFDDAYHLVYQEAKAGLSENTIRQDVKASWLSPAAFKLAYNAGQSEMKMPKGSRFTGSAGVRLNGIDYKSLDNKQRASVRALQTIAQITGIRIELFDSTQADGTLGEKQGWYSKGAIGIDINAGMLDKGDILNVAMLRTTSHELTHFIQDNNDTAYKELKDFVFSALQTYQFSDGKFRDADTWIRSKMSQNKWEYEEGTAEFNKYYQQASDECVADACEMMLRDTTAFETLAKENQSLAQKMLAWLKQLIADIKEAFSGVVETSLEARAMLDSLDELQQKWDAALVGAVQNTKEAESDQQSETETQNSIRTTFEQDERYMELAKDPQKNEAKLREMVEQAAEKAFADSKIRTKDGSLRRLYHGTNSDVFTRFDRKLIGAASGDNGFFGEGFYFSYHRGEANAYGRRVIDAYLNITKPFNFQTELQTIHGERAYSGYSPNAVFIVNFVNKFPKLADKLGETISSYTEQREMSLKEFANIFEETYDTLDYKVEEIKGELGKEYVVLADKVNDEYVGSDGKTHKATYYNYQRRTLDENITKADVVTDYLMRKYDIYRLPSQAVLVMDSDFTNTLIGMGYDGAIQSEDGDEVVAFYESQIKSADPVTYDDSGNVIPLSERFNAENEDIRYQLREQGLSAREVLSSALADIAETDAERSKLISYQRAVKSLDETQAQLDDIRSQIHDIMFTKGSDRSKLKSLETQKTQLEKKLDRWDKRLMSLQNTAPLKAVLNRERARVRKQTRAEVMENVREKRETSAVRESIKSMMEKWNSKLQSDTPARNIPAPFKTAIAELSQALDLTSGRPLSEKAVDKLNKLKSAYDYVMGDNDFKVYQNPITKMYVDNAINIINNTPLRQMGREQLESLYDAMKCINAVMFEANKLRDKTYRRDLAETGTAMITDTTEAIAPKWKFWRDYETWQLTPARFFAMLGGWKKGSAWEQVAASFQEGTRRALRVERDFYNMFRRFTEAPEIDRLTNPNKLIDIGLVGRDGKPVKITRGMMLSIYMHLLSEDNRRAILYGGLNVPVLLEYYGQKIKESYTTGHENVVGILEDMTKLSEKIYQLSTDKSLTDEEKQQKIEEIGKQQDKLEAEGYDRLDALKNRIYDEMTDFEKQLTETATAWNDGNSQNYINEVTMAQYQIKRAKVKNYWAIHRDTSFVQTDFESVAKNMNLANVGWLKDRVKSAAPVLLTDFVYEMDNSCKRVATFYGYAIAQADFNKLYNYKIPGVNKSVQDEVKRKFGGGSKTFGVTADQYVENFIGDVVGSRIKPDRSIWAAVRRNLPRATLTLNPRVALSQIASVPTAAAEVGWGAMAKGFIRGLPTAFNKNAKEQLMQRDEYFFQRYRGDGSMREFADMKSGNNVIDKLWGKADKLTKHALLNWCQNCDVFATATMWAMAEEWVKSNTDLTGEAFDAAVKQKYDDIITKTQPNYTKTERSDLLRDTREAYKFLTMYKTQSNQNFNILKEANARLRKTASDLKNGRNGVTQADLKQARKQFANAYSAVMLGGTLAFVVLRAIANAILGHMNDYRDDEDEITKASVLNGITTACMQSMANMFVLGSEVEALVEKSITGKKYYGLEDTALASANNVLKQLQALAVAYATGETDNIGAKWAKLTQNAAQIVGLPYSSVKTFIEAGKTWAADIERGTFGSFEGGVTRSNSVNYNRLYKALENGDTAKAERIREEIRRNSPDIEDKTIESGLRGVIKDMWEEGTITTSEAVDKIVEYTGKDPDTAYWDVQKWANKANAEDDEKHTDSNYYRLWQVIDNDGDAEAAMSELLEHGKDADQIAQDVRKHIKDAYTNGEITDTQARERLLKYDQHKVDKQLVPYTKAEVDKLVNGWVTSNTLGWDYDDKETLYAKGEISKSELKKALVDIGGMSSEKADQRIEVMDWNKEGYAVENDKYDSIIGKYNSMLKSKGVSKSIWYNYYVFQSQTSGEVDANGKSIPYSKMVKLFDYIGKLNITSDQKMALARTYTDSESSIAKYKTW